jgi:leucine-rich repeat protein SHOC2
VYLSDNQLTSLPVEIGMLTGMRELRLYNNQLTSLPAEIGTLTGLKLLNLSDNQLTSLPVEIGNMTGLQQPSESVGTRLDLRNNPLTTPPMEVCKEGITAIRAYFLEHPTEIQVRL